MGYELSELQQMVQKFCEDRHWDQFHGPKELAIGMVTEASELLQLFRYKNDEEGLDFLKEAVGRERAEDELADVFFQILRFSQLYDVDLTRAFVRKMEKNMEKYPVEKAKGRHQKYDDFEE